MSALPLQSSLPLCQIALSSIDLRRSEQWWREGLGFLPSAATRLFRGKTLSSVTQLANAAATTRWLVGQDHWLQIELWQFEHPVARLQPQDYAPNHIGFSRCGVWVKQFDATLQRLEQLGSTPLSEPQEENGQRRVCVRDPDGIYVELFEQDPLASDTEALDTETANTPAAPHACNAALRSITLTTPELASSQQFAEQGLGLTPYQQALHTDQHETLWGFTEVDCDRAVYRSAQMLLEYVQYRSPAMVNKHPHARINDQGILNIAFGDQHSVNGIQDQSIQMIEAGAAASDWLNSPVGGCVYMTDPLGFSFELVWAKPGFGHRFAGHIPNNKATFNAADNRQVDNTLWINAPADKVFQVLADHDGMSHWAGLGKVERIKKGINDDNGLMAERLVHSAPFRITEQITFYQPGKALHYRILSGGPFNNYSAYITLQETQGGTQVRWVNRFRAKVPGSGPILQLVLKHQFKNVLKRLARQCSVGRYHNE